MGHKYSSLLEHGVATILQVYSIDVTFKKRITEVLTDNVPVIAWFTFLICEKKRKNVHFCIHVQILKILPTTYLTY